MTDCNSVNIPIKTGCFIEISEPSDYNKVNIKSYQWLIGKLIYLGLVYRLSQSDTPAVLSPFSLIKYGDSSYVNDLKNRKLVIDYCYFLNRAVVSWCNKKYQPVSISTTEAQYIAFGYTIRETVWIRHFFNKLQVVPQSIDGIALYGDNEI